MEFEIIEIFCPLCKARVGRCNTKSKINKIMECKKCKKRIVYQVENGNIEVKSIPQRTCSSGLTFY